jgi:hypothetical protein
VQAGGEKFCLGGQSVALSFRSSISYLFFLDLAQIRCKGNHQSRNRKEWENDRPPALITFFESGLATRSGSCRA